MENDAATTAASSAVVAGTSLHRLIYVLTLCVAGVFSRLVECIRCIHRI